MPLWLFRFRSLAGHPAPSSTAVEAATTDDQTLSPYVISHVSVTRRHVYNAMRLANRPHRNLPPTFTQTCKTCNTSNTMACTCQSNCGYVSSSDSSTFV